MRMRLLVAAAAVVGTLIGVTVTAVPAQAAVSLPCDIYAAGGTPCVTAHSTTRALFASYNGPLYQVQRASDQGVRNIGVQSAGGSADAAAQLSFCANTTCTITKIYDQTTNHNDMPISWGGFWKGPGPNGSDIGANAAALPVTVNGHPAFGVKVTPGVGYRIDNAKNVPTGSAPEGIYLVTSSNLVGQFCCFDYGSGETSHTDTGNATMNAIEWGTACWFGGCTGSGPWVEADLENGMYSSNTGPNNANNLGVHFPFVSAMEKNNGTSNFTLKFGNAASGGLTTTWSGPLPTNYAPMKLQPSILLGTGGDNSNSAPGEFFEGAVTAGFPSDATENAVQSSLTAAGYQMGAVTGPTGPIVAGDNGSVCVDNNNASATPGNKVQMFTCNGNTAAQNWTVASDGTIQIDGGCLDITGANSANGTLIEWWTCNGGANQQWQATNGQLVNPTTGKCLDDPNFNITNGTQLILWTCNNGTNQQWHLP